jgi:uncharacterized protein (DUF924 family)
MKPREVLDFWFGAGTRADEVARRQKALWWGGGAAVDAQIRERFSAMHARATQGDLDGWAATASGRLALIIVLDQFSRNLYRGRAEAFAQDPRTLRLAREGIAAGDDRRLPRIRRVFFYMPLEHAEDLHAQRQSVERFIALRDSAPGAVRDTFDFFLDFAWQHYDIVARFGRFPHRNAILGRKSTPAEHEWLQDSGTHFGQR